MSADVLHVIAPAPAGGAESVVLALTAGLTARGHRSTVAAILDHDGPHPFVDECRTRGLCVHIVNVGHRRYRAQANAIASTAQRQRACLIHTHGFHGDVLGAWAGLISGLPIVTTLHGFTGGGFRDAIYDLPLRIAHRRAAAVVAVSTPIAARLAARGVRRDLIHRIPNAWAPASPLLSRLAAREALGIRDTLPRIAWVGRLSREKGADLMVEALSRLARPQVRLSILGGGPEERAVRSLAEARGVATQIDWHGMVRNASGHFAAFDALVLSSRTEGSPMVLLEAMASRLPIIAPTVGGVPEMLGDAEALLVPSERPDLLANAIATLLDDRHSTDLRARSAEARLTRDYDFDRWIARHERLYESVITSQAQAGMT